GGGAGHREDPALRHRQRGERRGQEPEAAAGRGRPGGLRRLREPGAVPEAGASRAHGPRLPDAQALRAPDGARGGTGVADTWVRRSIPSASAWASTRPGAAGGTRRKTT